MAKDFISPKKMVVCLLYICRARLRGLPFVPPDIFFLLFRPQL